MSFFKILLVLLICKKVGEHKKTVGRPALQKQKPTGEVRGATRQQAIKYNQAKAERSESDLKRY